MPGKKHACEYYQDDELDPSGNPQKIGPFPDSMYIITLFARDEDGDPIQYNILAVNLDSAIAKFEEISSSLRIKSIEHRDIYR